MKYRATVAYQGTHYCGWQKQRGSAASGAPSIQETIERSLHRVTREDVSVVGSGRTDAGVHANGQVAHFILDRDDLAVDSLRMGMNSLLPEDIRILKVEKVDARFHAQRSAKRKKYVYFLQQGPCALPAWRPRSWWIRRSLDMTAMNEAARIIIGERDFGIFQASGGSVAETVRTIFEVCIDRETGGLGMALPEGFSLIRVQVEGNGFLKQMVRGIVGCLVEVGEGKLDSKQLAQILDHGSRADLSPTAPARGLWLEGVGY